MESLNRLFDTSEGEDVLQHVPRLGELYGGPLSFPEFPAGRPFTVVNFVTTLEGHTSFNLPGHMGGGDISGFNKQDTFLMGLLRAVADGCVVGANTLRSEPEHLWTPDFISPEHAALYAALREELGKKEKHPVNMFVTGSGKVLPEDPSAALPAVFSNPDIKTRIITTKLGKTQVEKEFSARGLTPDILVCGEDREVDLTAAFKALKAEGIDFLLIEGGAGFNGAVVDAELYDEFFLTRAPQVIGNSKESPRPLFISGMLRSPEDALWHDLVSLKMQGSYLYERYRRREK
jgi:riboflavin biosynthesis pyrimidine reductase